MDALQMVNFARKWKNVPKQMHCELQKTFSKASTASTLVLVNL